MGNIILLLSISNWISPAALSISRPMVRGLVEAKGISATMLCISKSPMFIFPTIPSNTFCPMCSTVSGRTFIFNSFAVSIGITVWSLHGSMTNANGLLFMTAVMFIILLHGTIISCNTGLILIGC